MSGIQCLGTSNKVRVTHLQEGFTHSRRVRHFTETICITCLWASHLFFITANLRESQVKDVRRLVWMALPMPSTTTRSHPHSTSSSTSESGSRLIWKKKIILNKSYIIHLYRESFSINNGKYMCPCSIPRTIQWLTVKVKRTTKLPTHKFFPFPVADIHTPEVQTRRGLTRLSYT